MAGASASAKEAVEKAGGSVTTTYTKKVYSNKKGGPGKRQTRRAELRQEARSAQGMILVLPARKGGAASPYRVGPVPGIRMGKLVRPGIGMFLGAA